MTDIIDIANDQAEYFLQVALDRRQRPTSAVSAQFCEDCDEPIPLLRQQTIQGCATCVSCQGLRERRR
ncbi:TraR/DksA C4-type zinc finger protein [Pseudomonas sp. Env-44]|uniref:Transcriptional regulator n=2 Tax=Pseudomonas fluorescens group TaxID=136843 RepID=A0A0R2YJG6_9PSED|nr:MULTISPECIES: TraR/DksA C4-type zinc finger protein [Pseudomonas]KRP45374.1 transcriptional regulator [Pseudomonas libanensis]MBJ2218507.1 TraR/DksA C4-type zinc finger protein [Pseudomonas sp. MF7453]PRW88203.1 transcriptional regulator [Pseudomonas fluorescens]SDK64960.1 phage/conjugal plasmid C-4 type zinc finger protein, TraR family [Pseudomonas libanensis]